MTRRHPMPTITCEEYMNAPPEIQRAFVQELMAHWRENDELAEQADIQQDANRGTRLNESEPPSYGPYSYGSAKMRTT